MKRYTFKIATLLILLTSFFFSCDPKQGTVEDKGAVKNDTLDVREGKGEGPVGEGDHL